MRDSKKYWFTVNGAAHRYSFSFGAGMQMSEVAESFVRIFITYQIEPCDPVGRFVVRVFKSEKGKLCHGIYTVFSYESGFCCACPGEIEVAPF